MNELQKLITIELRVWTKLYRVREQLEDPDTVQSVHDKRIELFTQAEASGIINRWKYRNTFDRMDANPPRCDICGGEMYAHFGNGYDHDRMVCQRYECGAAIEFPTSTEV
jgi:hypothetical protein